MKDEDFEKYWIERYEDQVKWYDQKSISEQSVYRRLQWTLLILAALTPALIELRLEEHLGWPVEAFRFATITSVVVAILSGGLKTFKYQENWINYRNTCELLRKEGYYFRARIEDYSSFADDLDAARGLFVERVEGLISRESTLWYTLHKQDHHKTEKPKPA